MGRNLRLAMREIRKKKFFSLLMFAVCIISMHTVLTSITNTTSAAWQQRIFEESLGCDMSKVLHLYYQQTEESPEFTDVLTKYMDYISDLPGVLGVGRFDVTGMYFTELKASGEYADINAEIVKNGKYAAHADITRLLRADEKILTLVKGGISEYAEPASGKLPIYVSEVFKDILPVGTSLTDGLTDEEYEVMGYFARGSRWAEENDLIRFPMVSMDGWFIAPFSADSEADIMAQLSCLHNTYVLISDSADIDFLKKAISEYSMRHGFEASACVLTEEYEAYRMETETFTAGQIALAIFISVMALSSIIAVFTTNTILKRKQYGIFIANGFDMKDIAAGVVAEIAAIVLPSALIAWGMKYAALKQSKDLFRDILLTAHIRFTLPLCGLVAAAIIIIAALLPLVRIFKYQPCELIGGNVNGNY